MTIIFVSKRRVRTVRVETNPPRVVVRKRVERSFEIPPEVAEWLSKDRNIKLVNWIVFDSPAARNFRHPHSVRTLIVLLYARAMGIPIARIAKRFGMAHEQLYRIERMLRRCGILGTVYEVLGVEK